MLTRVTDMDPRIGTLFSDQVDLMMPLEHLVLVLGNTGQGSDGRRRQEVQGIRQQQVFLDVHRRLIIIPRSQPPSRHLS